MWVSGILYVKRTQTWPDKESIGLYGDDDLGVFHNIPKPEIERKKKQTLKTIKECGLSIIFHRFMIYASHKESLLINRFI